MLTALLIGLLAAPPESRVAQLDADAAAAFEAGRFAQALRRYREAEALLRGLEDRTADRARAQFLMATCLERLGRPAEALSIYEQALALPPAPDIATRIAGRIDALRARPARVQVDCADGHVVRLDDGRAARCGEAITTPPGLRGVRVSAADGRTRRVEVELAPGETRRLAVDLPPAPAPDRTAAWATTGAAAALVAGGTVAFVVAADALDDGDAAARRFATARAANDRDAARAAERDERAANERAEAARFWSYGLWAGGAALAGAATWLWLREPNAPTVVPGPDGKSVGLRWHW